LRPDVNRKTAGALLIVILVYTLLMHGWFIKADARPCNINELSHIMGPVDFVNLVQQRPSFYAAYLEAFNGYPPIGMVTSAFYALFGRTHDVAVFSQLLFTALLLIGIYALGAQLLDRKTGLLAAWLLAVCPAITEVSRQYLLELPLTATTVLAVWLLLATERFTDRRFSVAAGLAVGLSALAKQTFFVFLLGPILFVLPGWIRAIRHETPPRRRQSKGRVALRLTLSLLFATLVSWLLYRTEHRGAIENWFSAYPQYQLPYGVIFFVITLALLATACMLLSGRSTPLRNGIGAGLLTVLVASLWYFPKGVLNFVTYAQQMQMNVTQSNFTPMSLLVFYKAHLSSYYLGAVVLLAFVVSLALLALFTVGKRWLRRSFYLSDLLPERNAFLFVLLWFAVPFIAFFFINIQNEMNTVPLLPPLTLIVAAVIARVRLPYSAKTLKVMQSGRKVAGARATHLTVATVRWAMVAAVVVGGVLMITPLPDGTGDYQMLPGSLDREKTVDAWYARKLNPINYLVPRPDDWQERRIAKTMFDLLPPTGPLDPPPRILSMDVDFYFSWNTFWYMAKLMNKRVEIRSPWHADADLLDPASPEYIHTYDLILYRQPYHEIYQYARSDYISYKNLWKAFAFLDEQPEDFQAAYPVYETWMLPDESEAILLKKAE